jgi:hypothetical protein
MRAEASERAHVSVPRAKQGNDVTQPRLAHAVHTRGGDELSERLSEMSWLTGRLLQKKMEWARQGQVAGFRGFGGTRSGFFEKTAESLLRDSRRVRAAVCCASRGHAMGSFSSR